jgi:uncharacterized membrane protein
MEPASRLSQLRAEGKTKEEIYTTLLQEGWSISSIEQEYTALAQVKEGNDHQDHTIQVVVVLGALMIGLSVFVYVADRWGGIPESAKFGLLFLLMVASHTAGWHCLYQRQLNRWGQGFSLLGSLTFGALLFFLGEKFAVPFEDGTFLLLWLIGTLVLAHFSRQNVQYFLAFILTCQTIGLLLVQTVDQPAYLRPTLAMPTLLQGITILLLFAFGWQARREQIHESPDLY